MQNNQELEMYSSLLIMTHVHVRMLIDSIIIILVRSKIYCILQIIQGRKISWLQQTKLLFARKHSQLDGSHAWQGLLRRLFHWKSFAVPIDP